VSVFDKDGRLLTRWARPTRPRRADFAAPHGIAVDSSRNIFVPRSPGPLRSAVPVEAGCHTFRSRAPPPEGALVPMDHPAAACRGEGSMSLRAERQIGTLTDAGCPRSWPEAWNGRIATITPRAGPTWARSVRVRGATRSFLVVAASVPSGSPTIRTNRAWPSRGRDEHAHHTRCRCRHRRIPWEGPIAPRDPTLLDLTHRLSRRYLARTARATPRRPGRPACWCGLGRRAGRPGPPGSAIRATGEMTRALLMFARALGVAAPTVAPAR